MSTPQAFHQFAARLHGHCEPLGLVQYLLSGLQSLIPSDYNSWKELVFPRSPKAAAVFSPHNTQAASLLPAFQRYIKEHPVCRHWRETGTSHLALRWSDIATTPHIERTPLYNEFYRPLGVRHQLMVALEAKPSRLIYVALNRSKTPFTEQDRTLLTALQPHATHALRSVLQLRKLESTLASYSTFVDTLSHGIICLSPGFQIRWSSKQARIDLHAHFGWPANSTRLPTELQQRLTQPQEPGASPPTVCSFQSRAGSLFVRTLKKQDDCYLFLQNIERQPSFDTLKTFGLTDREAEVLGWVARGKSNEDTAVILGMGLHTVKKHLERIYSVLGVANRTEAALKANTILGGQAAL